MTQQEKRDYDFGRKSFVGSDDEFLIYCSESIGKSNALECLDQEGNADDYEVNVADTAHEYGVPWEPAYGTFLDYLAGR